MESPKSDLENWSTLNSQEEWGKASPSLFEVIMNAYNASVQTLAPEEFDKVMHNPGTAIFNYNPAQGTVKIEEIV